jgi:hypothetical protein
MLSNRAPPVKPPLSIEIDEDNTNNLETKKGKSTLIYKPDIKGSAPIQNYSKPIGGGTKTVGSKSPITLQLTEIIEKFKPSFVEESHDQMQESPRQPE